ncbi:hypothetical protein [Devosia sp.]|uniref:hypothetical protein n=1 Tax=Devosia sp. TaxID=1871048 RepID=UPI002EFC87FE
MTRYVHPLARVVAALGRGYRNWRAEQLLPSVLFDLNRSLGEDRGIVPPDLPETRRKRD